MVIKKFIAKSLPEALTKVKKDFGDEAVILKTRFNNKAAAGQNSKVVEVTAAIDNNSVKTNRFKAEPVVADTISENQNGSSVNRLKPGNGTGVKETSGDIGKTERDGSTPINRIKGDENKTDIVSSTDSNIFQRAENKPLPSEILGEIKEELSRLRSEFNQFTEKGEDSESHQSVTDQFVNELKRELAPLLSQNKESIFVQPEGSTPEYIRTLVEMHVPEETALEIVRKIPESIISNNEIEAGWNSLIEILSELLGPGEPVKMVDNGPTVIMLVGPPGSGKSSAAARLAFNYNLEEDLQVSLVTTDTFRADSKHQLSSLANVIGCSFTATSSPQELADLMKTIKEGLVVIDTSGTSCQQDMEELVSLIGAANPHEVHLVIPADIPASDLEDYIQKYPEIGIDRVLVTKLDQTIYRGGIIGIAAKLGAKFSFESSSRDLPGEFNLFNPEVFVSAVKSMNEKVYPQKDE
jgi:flagellar biosynthesis protein FlhF